MTSYQHTQFASAIVWPLLVAIAISCALAFVSPIMRLSLVVALPLALVLAFFWKLTITIDEHVVRASFGPGFVYKEISLAQIESAVPVRTTWWEGWGIHRTRFGWLYNVSGSDAVAIRLRNGRQLALGTDQPEELAAAIGRAAR